MKPQSQSDLNIFVQSINAHLKRDPKKGVVNNQILDWAFKLDGIFHNATQEHVFSTVASDMVTSALNGYNGKWTGEFS